MINLLFLARPGAGKGTQAKLIAKKFNLIHLSSGSLLRQEIAAETELGKKIKDTQITGDLVSDSLIIELIKNKLADDSKAEGFIFDGFPRTRKQAEALDKILAEKKYPLNLVIVLDITAKEMMKRLLSRAKIESRQDDNEETILARGKIYDEQTEPLIEYYKKQNKLTIIDGEREIPKIYDDLDKIVGQLQTK